MARLAVTRERHAGETRVALTPDAVKKLVAQGLAVSVEAGAGLSASAPDADYAAAGATVATDLASALVDADILLKVRGPAPEEIAAQWDHVESMLAERFDKAAALMRRAKEEVLAFRTFPRAHWRQIWSTNPLERLNKEIKRRSRVVDLRSGRQSRRALPMGLK